MMNVVGCKLLRADGSSLTDEHPRVAYPVGEWISVPGNGAYVAVTGGIDAGGIGPVLAYFECADRMVSILCPDGVQCFRSVRRLKCPAPELISPSLRGDLALSVDSLSPDERYGLAYRSTENQRGLVACLGRGISPTRRFVLAMGGPHHHRERLAAIAVGLSVWQRSKLARGASLGTRRGVVRDAPCASEVEREQLRTALLLEGDDPDFARVRWTLEYGACAPMRTLTGDVLVVGQYDESGVRSEEHKACSIRVAGDFGRLCAVPGEYSLGASQVIVRGMLEEAAPRASWRELSVVSSAASQGVVRWLE